MQMDMAAEIAAIVEDAGLEPAEAEALTAAQAASSTATAKRRQRISRNRKARKQAAKEAANSAPVLLTPHSKQKARHSSPAAHSEAPGDKVTCEPA